MNNKSIAVCGSILVDEINIIKQYPNSGTLTEIYHTEKSVGGLVPNVGIDLKKINPSLNVLAYGSVGSDSLGDFVLSTLKDNNLDISNIIINKDEKTSFTEVMSVEHGERTFFTYPGTSSSFGYNDIDFNNLNVDLFHLGYFLLLERIDNGDGIKILQKLNELNIKTSIDLITSSKKNYDLVLPVLPYVDYLIINELEASGLTKIEDTTNLYNLSKALKDLGVKDKVIIHKEDMACLYDGEEYIEFKSLIVPKEFIKGKTGAGDAFCAGCLTEIVNGSSNKDILDFGIRTAAISLNDPSATGSLTTKDNIIKITNNYKRS